MTDDRTIEQLKEEVEEYIDAASEALSNAMYNLNPLLQRAKELEQSNAALKASLHEATELLQRGYDLIDDSGLDVGFLVDVDTFMTAMRSMTEREKEDDPS